MIKDLENLNQDEINLLYKAPVWVAILLAGADSKIDKKEIKAAVLAAKWHPGMADSILARFYRDLSLRYEVELKGYISLMPREEKKRSALICKELERLNDLWPKLDKKFAIRYFQSLKDIARKVAASSGGILGVLNIGPEERRYLELQMISNPSTISNE